MLTEQERTSIDEELKHAPMPHSVVIEALRIVQRERGWVSDESVRDIAAYLEMTADEVDGVATFYNMIFRRPVGKHVIFLCESISCWVMGCDQVRKRLEDRLGIKPGETTPDGMFTLLPVDCLGACDRAPAVIVDETLHANVDDAKIDSIIDEIRQRG